MTPVYEHYVTRMKTIPNSPITLHPIGQPPRDVRVSKLISDVAMAPSDGLTLDEQRRRFRIVDAAEAADLGDGPILLEDADYANLVKLVERMPWAWPDRGFIAFGQLVSSAETAPKPG